jgi:muramoyltetrapeptide carboxypeptidase
MNIKNLLPLQPGDLVDLVSPGSSSRLEDVEMCIDLLESWGLKARLPKETFQSHPFHSNEDEVRLKLLKKALVATDSKAVWCLRGGYGANRLLPELWKMKAPVGKKMLIGYSDITSLLVFLNQKWKWNCFHGPLLETMISGRLPMSQVQECKQVIFGEKKELNFSLQALNSKAKKMNSLKAPLIGGNLVVLESAIGTPYAGKFSGKILVLEEVGERGYRIDRMLEHLKQASALKGCKAIVFGDFLHGDERDGKNFVRFALERFAAQNEIACFSGLEMGHGENNRMIPIGPQAILKNSELMIPTGVEKKAPSRPKRK